MTDRSWRNGVLVLDVPQLWDKRGLRCAFGRVETVSLVGDAERLLDRDDYKFFVLEPWASMPELYESKVALMRRAKLQGTMFCVVSRQTEEVLARILGIQEHSDYDLYFRRQPGDLYQQLRSNLLGRGSYLLLSQERSGAGLKVG